MSFEWTRFLFWCAITVGGGLTVFHAVAGYYHVRYYVLRRDEPHAWKCQPDRWLPKRLVRRAAISSSSNMAIGGVLTAAVITAIEGGWNVPIYLDVAAHGWLYTLASTLLLFVLMDWIAYHVHRLMHSPVLYKRFHRNHHTYVATTPYVTVAMHPVELFALQGMTLLPIFIIPFYIWSIVGVLLYILVFNIIDHSGVRLASAWPWQPSSKFHDDHHALFHVNFGQHLPWWDKMHGTMRREGQSYGPAVFGGKGKRDPGDKPGPFVRY